MAVIKGYIVTPDGHRISMSDQQLRRLLSFAREGYEANYKRRGNTQVEKEVGELLKDYRFKF